MNHQAEGKPDAAGAAVSISPGLRDAALPEPFPEAPGWEAGGCHPDGEVEKEMGQVQHLADAGLWHGVHVALTWYRESLASSGRADALALIGRMDAEVAKARLREPGLGWGNHPTGRILWSADPH